MKVSVWKSALLIFAIIAVLALALLDLFLHDFHTVIPHQIYRSRQLSKQQFAKAIDQYKLKSILNLRGAHPGTAWYDNEIQISKQEMVHHYNVALNSTRLPTPKQFQRLVNIIETAPRPLLIHCESGVDRSGLASAISLILANQPLQDAQKQISWEYFVLKPDSTGKQFMALYKKWLMRNNTASSKKNFLQWLNQYEGL